MKTTILLPFIVLLFGSFIPTTTLRIYEIQVEARLGNCTNRQTITVEARNTWDARESAQRIVQSTLTTRVTRTKEVRKP